MTNRGKNSKYKEGPSLWLYSTKIVTKDGTIGKIAMLEKLDKPATLNSHLFLIRNLKPDVLDTTFLFYILRSSLFQKYAQNNTSGSNIPAFTQKNISEFEIDLPSIDLQRKISGLLSNLDDKIRNNNTINSELESIAKTIYDYWFLQFEFPDENGKPYKSSGGKMVWNEDLKREIPEGWEVFRFGEIASFVKGKIPETLHNEKKDTTLHPYLTIDVVNGGKPQFCKKDRMPYCNGEPIMVMDGAASGDVYVGVTGVLGSTFAMIQPLQNGCSNSLLYRILLANKEVYKRANTGSTVPHANRKFIENMFVCVPSNKSFFVNHFETIQRKINKNREENQELVALRDFLLPLLMNGQVRFKETK